MLHLVPLMFLLPLLLLSKLLQSVFLQLLASLVPLLFGFQAVAGVHIVDGVTASSSIFAVS